MLAILSYDIRNPSRLAKVAKTCEFYGIRVQYSVFELRVDEDELGKLWEKLKKIIDPNEDRITCYKICSNCAEKIRDAGVQEHHEKVVAYVF